MEDHHSRIDRPLQAKPHLEILPNPCSEMTMNKKMIMSTDDNGEDDEAVDIMKFAKEYRKELGDSWLFVERYASGKCQTT
jgi:hypothetical protein